MERSFNTTFDKRRPEDLVPRDLKKKFWLVSADMGYGHQRAIYPLKALAGNNQLLNANHPPNATEKELRLWRKMLGTYEFLSRAGNFPVIGSFMTRLLDSLLYIPKYIPGGAGSNPTLQVKYLRLRIKKGLCKGITEQIKDPELAMITSFYTSAIAADMAGHSKIFCIICDTDLNRVWVPEDASSTQIIYFAPGTISVRRLLSYGVPEKNILLTGFPLPLELLGDRSLDTLKENLKRRLENLDPEGIFYNLYRHSVDAYLKDRYSFDSNNNTGKGYLTITYAVGGAGAQKETGRRIVKSLAGHIEKGKIRINLVAGTRTGVRDYFLKAKRELTGNNGSIRVIWAKDNESYFDLFNKCLHITDILWTKPSELSFYSALGIPIIMTPAIGPQEKCNLEWLVASGAGFRQQNPESADQWLIDLLNKGQLAEAAWHGFLKGRKFGTYNILEFLEKGSFRSSNDPLKR